MWGQKSLNFCFLYLHGLIKKMPCFDSRPPYLLYFSPSLLYVRLSILHCPFGPPLDRCSERVREAEEAARQAEAEAWAQRLDQEVCWSLFFMAAI
jgi:hypothetical protein